MKSKTRLLMIVLFFLGLTSLIYGSIAGFSLLSNSQPQSFSLIGDEIWLPKYFTGECVPRPENNAEKTISSHTDNGEWYSCTSSESGTYIPIVNGIQCEYFVSEFSFATIYVCDTNGGSQPTNTDDSRCVKDRGVFDTFLDGESAKRVVVNSGDSVYIDTDRPFGVAKLTAKYPAYGLRVRSSDGFVSSTTLSCEINSLTTQYHTIDVEDRTEIVPSVPFNAVSGLQKAISTQAVILDDVENRAEIYISRPGYYYLIKVADDGFKYVDTSENEKYDNDIECIPRTTGCSDEAKIVNLEDQSCDQYGGAITGYSPVTGDSTRLCKYSCSSGTLKLTSDCIAVQTDCPEDKPLWDSSTGLCTAVETSQEDDPSYSFLWYLIGGIIILFLTYRAAILGGKK